MELGIGTQALLWGLASAVSLPLGAALGLWWQPKRKLSSSFTAFGAGALIFALTIELFGHVPHYVEEHGFKAFLAAFVGAVTGGLLFDVLNQYLNNRGAFMRRLSHARRHVARLRLRRTRSLVEELGRVEILRFLLPEQVAKLVQRGHDFTFKKGEVVFEQGEVSEDMYFIVSGEVEITVEEADQEPARLALLGKHETFGELGVLCGGPRTAKAQASSDLRVYTLSKVDFDEFMSESAELQEAVGRLADSRISELSLKSAKSHDQEWKKKTLGHLAASTHAVSVDDIVKEGQATGARGAALAIWLGIFIDGIPESFVIGMLAVSATGMSLSFIAGVFLANFPEAMSSAVSMEKSGMSRVKIYFMWGSITVITGLGAFLSASLFPADPTGGLLFFVIGVEALAGGAMLTMIAETMLPEAFEQGGAIVGLSTLLGFLATLLVKVL